MRSHRREAIVRLSIKRMSIAWRLHLVTGATLLILGLVSVSAYVWEAARLEESRVATLRGVVQSALGIVSGYEAQVREGRMTEQQAKDAAIAALRIIRYFGNEYVWVNDMQPRIVMHPIKPELDGKDVSGLADPNGVRLFAVAAETVRTSGSGVIAYLWPRPGDSAPVPKLSYVEGFKPWGWVVGSGVYVDDVVRARHQVGLGLLAVTILAGGAVGGFIGILGRGIARPVVQMEVAMRRLADGDLTTEIPALDRGDEVGGMAQAMLVFRQNALQASKLRAEAERVREARDRRQAAMDQNTNDFSMSISGVMVGLSRAADLMREQATDMSGAAGRTRELARETAGGAATSSDNLAAVAAAADQMSSSIAEIGKQVSNATGAVRMTVERATATDARIGSLVEATQRVGAVVQLIARIAAQTNLLALNATIEAARAGAAGKGFAVVAGEVKALASQTAKATEEISSQIVAIRDATDGTVEAVRDMSSAIGRVDQVASAIAESVEQQGAATRDIVAGVHTLVLANRQATQAMQDLSKMSGTVDHASVSVLQGAGQIKDTAETLRDEVSHFIDAMTRTDEDERRRYDRVPGRGAEARLCLPGQPELAVGIVDISRSGVSLRCSVAPDCGTEVRIVLPGAGADVAARVIRADGRSMALAFRQDPVALEQIDRALDSVSVRPGALAA